MSLGNPAAAESRSALATPALSSSLAEAFGWRGVFFGAAGLMTLMALVMGLVLPRRLPAHRASYPALIASVFALARRHAPLRLTGNCIRAARCPS